MLQYFGTLLVVVLSLLSATEAFPSNLVTPATSSTDMFSMTPYQLESQFNQSINDLIASRAANEDWPHGEMPDIPYPFTRNLIYTHRPVGSDVYVLVELLRRHFATTLGIKYTPEIAKLDNPRETEYTRGVALLVRTFQTDVQLPSSGVVDKETAKKIIDMYAHLDNYKDNNVKASDFGMKFKIYVPVHRDRSIETMATLFDAENNELLKFKTRSHGKTDPKATEWPQYDDTVGQNEFVTSGNTPTGLSYMDLNTPEPPAFFDHYGPYDVTRFTVGIKGNAAVILPHIRNGILLHTGNWKKYGWDGVSPMPNSSGCLHSPPEDIEKIAEILKSLGVVANENPFGTLPYPFEPQGIVSVELVE